MRRSAPARPARTAPAPPAPAPRQPGPGGPRRVSGTTLLQPFVWPDPAICSERELFVRLKGPGGLSQSAGQMLFGETAHVQFDTYFNLFSLGKWQTHCGLGELGLQLAGTGRIEATVFLAFRDRSWMRLVNEVVTLNPDRARRLEIPLAETAEDAGVLFFEFRALEAGRLDWAGWDTREAPRRHPALALSMTTFRREAAARRAVARFEAFAAQSRLGDHMHMIVVDNGQSAGIESTGRVTAIANRNLGGAGGFARGLIAARARGASHCLFMDDDATTPPDALERTWMFLAYATDPATAVAGAMISTRHAWALWENGALFDGACLPQHGGTDLRDPARVFAVEFETTAPRPGNFYGGWWYFAFPLAAVTHLPFPFFVRGDDVSFSLVHDFNSVTLPGVVSFQESFTEKDSPLTWYLDLRSHLAHHLSLPAMDIGRWRTIRIAVWFWARTLLCCHYETMAAVNAALSDVLEGPDFFAENADMATRRAEIGALRRNEAWAPRSEPPPGKRRINPHNRLARMAMRLTLNGHLLPGFSVFGNRLTLPAEKRWAVRETWGAAQITYYDAGRHKAYTVRHSKSAALRETWRLARLCLRLGLRYDDLKARYQAAYPELTGTAFWTRLLGLAPEEAAPAPAPPGKGHPGTRSEADPAPEKAPRTGAPDAKPTT